MLAVQELLTDLTRRTHALSRVVARPTSSPHQPRRLLSALGTRSRFPHSSHDAPGVLGSGAPAVMGLTAREVDKTR